MVCATMEAVKDERGRDLKSINEKVYDDPAFNAELVGAIQAKVKELAPKEGEWSDAWEQVKETVRTMSLTRTQELRTQRNAETDKLRELLRYEEARTSAGLATAEDHAKKKELQDKIRELTRKSTR